MVLAFLEGEFLDVVLLKVFDTPVYDILASSLLFNLTFVLLCSRALAVLLTNFDLGGLVN